MITQEGQAASPPRRGRRNYARTFELSPALREMMEGYCRRRRRNHCPPIFRPTPRHPAHVAIPGRRWQPRPRPAPLADLPGQCWCRQRRGAARRAAAAAAPPRPAPGTGRAPWPRRGPARLGTGGAPSAPVPAPRLRLRGCPEGEGDREKRKGKGKAGSGIRRFLCWSARGREFRGECGRGSP